MPSRNLTEFGCMALLLCALSLTASGCGPKSAKAVAPVATAPAPAVADSKPITNIAPDTNALPPVEAVTPPPSNDPPAVTEIPVTPARTRPAPPPRKPAPEPAAETAASEQASKPAAPQIVPQISAGDQLSFERKTKEDVDAARANLQQAVGKQLSPAQTDLVQKIQSFLSQSQEASKAGDWTRAQTLSQKARLLSVELVESF